MKLTTLFFLIAVTFFSSCKKCMTCTCYKNGSKTTEKECAVIIGSDEDKYFKDWKDYIIKENSYEKCDCDK